MKNEARARTPSERASERKKKSLLRPLSLCRPPTRPHAHTHTGGGACAVAWRAPSSCCPPHPPHPSSQNALPGEAWRWRRRRRRRHGPRRRGRRRRRRLPGFRPAPSPAPARCVGLPSSAVTGACPPASHPCCAPSAPGPRPRRQVRFFFLVVFAREFAAPPSHTPPLTPPPISSLHRPHHRHRPSHHRRRRRLPAQDL